MLDHFKPVDHFLFFPYIYISPQKPPSIKLACSAKTLKYEWDKNDQNKSPFLHRDSASVLHLRLSNYPPLLIYTEPINASFKSLQSDISYSKPMLWIQRRCD